MDDRDDLDAEHAPAAMTGDAAGADDERPVPAVWLSEPSTGWLAS